MDDGDVEIDVTVDVVFRCSTKRKVENVGSKKRKAEDADDSDGDEEDKTANDGPRNKKANPVVTILDPSRLGFKLESMAHIKKKNSRTISIGCDFAGLAAEHFAMKYLKIPSETLFACEVQASCRKLLAKKVQPVLLMGDVRERLPQHLPPVDVFVSGFPCQPFSSLGSQAGENDMRGLLVHHSLAYIAMAKPPVVLLENVAALPQRHRHLFETILTAMRGHGYNTYDSIQDTSLHGIPHRRQRMIIVCLRKNVDNGSFSWPSSVPAVPLDLLLDHEEKPSKLQLPPDESGWELARKNVIAAYKELKEKNVSPMANTVVIDTGASPKFQNYQIGTCPCITATRGGSCDFWISSRNREIRVLEMARLQGYASKDLSDYSTEVSDHEMGKMLGNGLSVNVLERVLPRALAAVDKLKEVSERTVSQMDIWGQIPEAKARSLSAV